MRYHAMDNSDQSVRAESHTEVTISASQTAQSPDEENAAQFQPRITQASSLVKKLPFDVQCLIFKNLGPASRRILCASCSSFYDTYKSHFYDAQIAVHYDEAYAAHRRGDGTLRYRSIITNWLIPEDGIVTVEEAERNEGMRRECPRMEMPKKQLVDQSYWLGWILYKHQAEGHGAWVLDKKRKVKISDPVRIPYGGKAVLELDGRPILPIRKRAGKRCSKEETI